MPETAPRHALPVEEEPLLQARALQVAMPRGVVFSALDLDLPRGGIGVLLGPSGSGRSTALLALTGRMRHVTGELLVDDHDGVRHPGRVRRLSSVARLSDVIAPERTLTLDESITERSLMDAGRPRERAAHYLHAAGLLDLTAQRSAMYRDLDPLDRTKAALALACVRPCPLVVLDDLDAGLTLAEQADLWEGLAALSAEGTALLVSTAEAHGVPASATTVDLS